MRKAGKIGFDDAKFSLEHPLRSLSILPLNTLRPRVTRAVYLGIYRRYRPRRFHAFCVGAFKSGTHSIAGMLMHRYRSSHEPRVPELISAVLALSRGEIAKHDLQRLVHRRDRALWLTTISVCLTPCRETDCWSFEPMKFRNRRNVSRDSWAYP